MVASGSHTRGTQPTAIMAPRLDSTVLPSVTSHLANRPSMTIDEQRIFGRFRMMNLPTYTVRGITRASCSRVCNKMVVASGVPFQKVVDVAKELKMIRRERFEQHEGKKSRHSGNFGSTPPRSQGYIRRGYHSHSSRPIHAMILASEADYVGHISSSSMRTLHGSSSRPVGRRRHFVNSCYVL
ncbi:hypothetical protein KY289_013526 [Solanum tuberosum]|nr:hypothetical protein KY289_013526 [Solanum tuberosum]